MQKRYVLALLALLALFVFAGCGGGGTEPTTEEPTTEKEPDEIDLRIMDELGCTREQAEEMVVNGLVGCGVRGGEITGSFAFIRELEDGGKLCEIDTRAGIVEVYLDAEFALTEVIHQETGTVLYKDGELFAHASDEVGL